jgi:ABC-2 type transport system ATP-binding protein
MLLRTEHLAKDYNGFRALDGLQLSIAPGEVFGLLGPNGSGKTTALRLILGFLKPSGGSAWVDGHDCWHEGVAARRAISYLPGELRLYENMTGRQLVTFLSRLRGQPLTAEIDKLAQRLEIDLDRPLSQLSSGMKRKVALLQVLIPHARLLILDEPTNALDPTMRDELLLQLRRARDQGQAVLFSSHVLSEVERVCDRVGILQRGRLVHVQEMSQLQDARLVRATFDKPVDSLQLLPGLTEYERSGNRIGWQYDGALPPLLEWLSRLPVSDLTIQAMGLAPIYHRYHGAQE